MVQNDLNLFLSLFVRRSDPELSKFAFVPYWPDVTKETIRPENDVSLIRRASRELDEFVRHLSRHPYPEIHAGGPRRFTLDPRAKTRSAAIAIAVKHAIQCKALAQILESKLNPEEYRFPPLKDIPQSRGAKKPPENFPEEGWFLSPLLLGVHVAKLLQIGWPRDNGFELASAEPAATSILEFLRKYFGDKCPMALKVANLVFKLVRWHTTYGQKRRATATFHPLWLPEMDQPGLHELMALLSYGDCFMRHGDVEPRLARQMHFEMQRIFGPKI